MPGRDPPLPGELVNHRPRLGFHCTFIPCFTPCIPERTVFNPLRLVGSDSKDPHQHPSRSASGLQTRENKRRASLNRADPSYLKNKPPPGACTASVCPAFWPQGRSECGGQGPGSKQNGLPVQSRGNLPGTGCPAGGQQWARAVGADAGAGAALWPKASRSPG